MPKRSAGILLFRKSLDNVEVLLVHPGGPFWANRNKSAWSIPKGEYDEREEDAQAAAKRELLEETGIVVSGRLIALGTYKQPSGKLVSAWAAEGEFDPRNLKSNSCRVEWPPKSGRFVDVPEADDAAWFSFDEAQAMIAKGQVPILHALKAKLVAGAQEPKESGRNRN